ncbi:hypothetical protein ABPG72_016555 [Tetrahymena utriculariae]
MEEDLSKNNLHIRNCMLYEFSQGKNATKAAEQICSVYGEGTVSIRVCQNWFQRFRSGDYNLNDSQRSGRPIELFDQKLEDLLEEDPRQSTRELADQLGFDHTTVGRRLAEMGKVQRIGKWIPHQLSQNNKTQRLNISLQLTVRFQKKDFLWQIVTGDEKWIYFSNPYNQKQWLSPGENPSFIPKNTISTKKAMLCVWWDLKGILYYELLEPNQSIDSERYSKQLKILSSKIAENRIYNGKGKRKIILLHDNARPHVSKFTTNIIQELGWEVLPHPAYSPDLAPSDYHLFRSMEHYLREKQFNNIQDLRNFIESYFNSKDQQFFNEGIRNLPNKWKKVLECNGDYFYD